MAVRKKVGAKKTATKAAAPKKRAARASTASQRARAIKLGLRVTKTVRGKRVYLDSPTLLKKIEAATKKKKTVATRAKKKRTTVYGTSDKSADSRIKAKPAGKRKAKAYSMISYKVFDSKGKWTGKWKKVRRKNATSSGGKYITPTVGNTYTERRKNRTDSTKRNI
tara:strand:+ start:588 stop:1085 length:498 start_codon:yes stop_codon:yes gene_type:complete